MNSYPMLKTLDNLQNGSKLGSLVLDNAHAHPVGILCDREKVEFSLCYSHHI